MKGFGTDLPPRNGLSNDLRPETGAGVRDVTQEWTPARDATAASPSAGEYGVLAQRRYLAHVWNAGARVFPLIPALCDGKVR